MLPSRCYSISYSSILPQASRDSGCVLALCFCFRFYTSLLDLSSSLSSAILTLVPINLPKCTQLFVNRIFNCIPKRDRCLLTSHSLNCIPKVGRKSRPHPANGEYALQDLTLRHLAINYRRSGNFRVKNNSCFKFSC